MSAPLACTRCGTAYEPVGANHTHHGECPQCQALLACSNCDRRAEDVFPMGGEAFCEDLDACATRVRMMGGSPLAQAVVLP